MRRPFPLVLLFTAALLLVPAVAFAAAPTPTPTPASTGPALGPGEPPAAFDIVKVNGIIDRSMADYLLGALEDAESRGAAVII